MKKGGFNLLGDNELARTASSVILLNPSWTATACSELDEFTVVKINWRKKLVGYFRKIDFSGVFSKLSVIKRHV